MPRTPPSRSRLLLLWLVLALIWGSTWSVVKIGLKDMPPFALLGVRMIFGTTACALWARRRGGFRLPPRGGRRWLAVSLVGQFLIPLPLLFWGGNLLDSGLTALVFATAPLWTAFTAAALGWERVPARSYLGLAVGIGGLAVLLVPAIHGHTSMAGLLAVLGGALAIGSSATAVKRHSADWDFPSVLSLQFALNGLWCLLLTFVAREPAPHWGLRGLGAAAYLGTVATVGAYVGILWLYRHLSAVSTTMLVLADTLVALVIGSLVLREPMGLRTLVATLGVFGGFLLTLDWSARAQPPVTP
jgi:drug/metabolite transporter (DMT)-like permease